MEQYLSVREARRRFAELINTAAFGDYRMIVVRHQVEVGGFVNMDDIEFLRRFKPRDASGTALKALRQAVDELDSRQFVLEEREARAARLNADDEDRAELRAEREQLEVDRAQLLALARALGNQRAPAATATTAAAPTA